MKPQDLLEDTCRLLGLADPTPLRSLSDSELSSLRDLVETARARERASLDAAIDGAMNHVPFLVRGAVRRILFPS